MQYYPGQVEFLARVATKDYAYIAADTGTGKSLFLLSLARLKLESDDGVFRGRALVVVPGGTLRAMPSDESDPDDADGESSDANGEQMSQWRAEIARFAPEIPVYELTCWEDYKALLRPDGSTPPGIYVTYYEAMFRNGALHRIPDSWDDKAHEKLCQAVGVPVGEVAYAVYAEPVGGVKGMGRWFEAKELHGRLDTSVAPRKGDVFRFGGQPWAVGDHICRPMGQYHEGVGTEVRGIRCVAKPCLSDEILMWCGARRLVPWDFVALDEAHYCTNLSAQLTQSFIRVPAKHRFAFTATPIPNIVTNLFPLMGWLCVPEWHKGGARNASWPYTRKDIGIFTRTFISEERDITEEESKKGRRTRCIRTSPVISAPARLLKLLKPTMAFISKPMCRDEYQPAELIDIRVPLGTDQAKLYQHYLCRSRVPGKHPLARARRQIAWLRKICADPSGFEHGGHPVSSNFNPKTVAALNLVREIIDRGEQVVVISARIGQTETIARRLREAGVPYARIDSTVAPDMHTHEANRFKAAKVPVMLMGIKCAAGHSFDRCPNEIILSLEYSYGSLHQARGRVDRVNSLRPARIYCILHKDSLEEAMFDRVATKEDAARICLHGKRVPRDYKPMDAGEVLAEHMAHWETDASRSRKIAASLSGSTLPTHIEMRSELDCESEWPALRDAMKEGWAAMRKATKQAQTQATPPAVILPPVSVELAPVAPAAAPVQVPDPTAPAPTPHRRPAWLDRIKQRLQANAHPAVTSPTTTLQPA